MLEFDETRINETNIKVYVISRDQDHLLRLRSGNLREKLRKPKIKVSKSRNLIFLFFRDRFKSNTVSGLKFKAIDTYRDETRLLGSFRDPDEFLL